MSMRSYTVRIAEKIVPSAMLPVPEQVTLAAVLKSWEPDQQAKVLEQYVHL